MWRDYVVFCFSRTVHFFSYLKVLSLCSSDVAMWVNLLSSGHHLYHLITYILDKYQTEVADLNANSPVMITELGSINVAVLSKKQEEGFFLHIHLILISLELAFSGRGFSR